MAGGAGGRKRLDGEFTPAASVAAGDSDESRRCG